MPYCKPHETATVVYSFKDKIIKQYVSNKAPIDVIVEAIPIHDGGQCLVEYHIVGRAVVEYKNFMYYERPQRYGNPYLILHEFDTRLNGSPIPGKILRVDPLYTTGYVFGGSYGYDLPVQNSLFPKNHYSIPNHRFVVLQAGEGELRFEDFSYNTVRSAQITQVIRVDGQPDECGDLKPQCNLIVKHNNVTIFSEQNDCPCKFEVRCDGCPEGTLKCNAPGYPGYCCLPCAPIASSIKAIKNTVQALNKSEVSRG